jgi:hypothetical protein
VVWVREQPGELALVALAIAHMSFVIRDLPSEIVKRTIRARCSPKAKSMAAAAVGTIHLREDIG